MTNSDQNRRIKNLKSSSDQNSFWSNSLKNWKSSVSSRAVLPTHWTKSDQKLFIFDQTLSTKTIWNWNFKSSRAPLIPAQSDEYGSYMCFFAFKEVKWCIDATKETGKFGRLLNHKKKGPNCSLKIIEVSYYVDHLEKSNINSIEFFLINFACTKYFHI